MRVSDSNRLPIRVDSSGARDAIRTCTEIQRESSLPAFFTDRPYYVTWSDFFDSDCSMTPPEEEAPRTYFAVATTPAIATTMAAVAAG